MKNAYHYTMYQRIAGMYTKKTIMNKNIVWIFLLLCSLRVYSQSESSLPRINIKSPEVAAFMKVGDIPVSLYSGIPQISIPLYEVRCGELRLPISLDYQATAIPVNQEATWVGLNWLLNAGGMVTTRSTLSKAGAPAKDWGFLYNKMNLREVYSDDFGRHYKMDGCHEMGWKGSYGYNFFKCIVQPKTADISPELYGHIMYNREGEAQSYSANFMGHSFDFIYHPLQEKFIVTGNDRKFKIVGGDAGIEQITDADGIQYTFGIIEDNNPNATNSALFNALINKSYYLTQIKHPDGRTIKLNYKQYDWIRLLPELQETWYYGLTNKTNSVEKELSPVLKIHNYYLYEIVTDEETVRFNVGTRIDLKGARKVNNIEVRDKKENLVKRFNFVYSYMNGSSVGGDRLYDYYEKRNMLSAYNSLYNSNEINQRLLLISLQEEVPDAAGALKKLSPYRFKYNAALPAKTSSARDYWGYFNGKDNTTLLVSRSKSGESGYNNFPYSTTTSLIYADRRCNPTTVSAGMLSGMVYPTGGETSFSYEPHSFTNYIYLDTRYTQLPASFSLSVVATNANTVIPEEYRKPKDFTIDRDTEVEVSISHYCPAGESWRDMLGSPAFIYIYEQIPSSGAPIISFHPYKGWAITPADTLNAVNGSIMRTERLLLPAGKYQLKPTISSPQIVPGPNFHGEKTVNIKIKNTGTVMSYGGGVRIKEIRQVDDQKSVITTKYDYSKESGVSSGLLMTPLRFARRKLQLYQADRGPGHDTPGGVEYPAVPAPVLKEYWQLSSDNMALPRGPLLGYERVAVIRYNGKKVCEYWNKKNMGASSFDFTPQLPDPRNGNLLKESDYSVTGKLVRESAYTYTVLKKEHYYVNAVVEDIYYGPDACSPVGWGNDYAISTNGARMLFCIYPSSKFWIEPTRRVVKEYTDNGTLTTMFDYTYNPWNLQLATTKTTYNAALNETVHTIYPQNYATIGSYPATLVNKNILNTPTEIVKVVTRNGVSSVVAGDLNRYNDNGQLISHARLKLAKPLSMGSFEFSNKVQGQIGTDTLSRGAYSPSSAYLVDASCGYTAGGNLSYVTEKQDLTTVYLWSYNKRRVIAEISNTTLAELKKALGYTTDAQFTSLESESAPDVSGIRAKLDSYFKGSQSLVTTYTYSPFFGLTLKTDPNGNITHYNYDEFGRLKSVTDRLKKTVQNFEYHYKNQ